MKLFVRKFALLLKKRTEKKLEIELCIREKREKTNCLTRKNVFMYVRIFHVSASWGPLWMECALERRLELISPAYETLSLINFTPTYVTLNISRFRPPPLPPPTVNFGEHDCRCPYRNVFGEGEEEEALKK